MKLKRSPHTFVRAVLMAAAAVTVTGAAAQASDAQKADTQKIQKGKEKCYGVAKAGENGCQALSGSHTCGGCSSADYRGEDWKWVPSGTCLTLGGQLQPFEGFSALAVSTPRPKATGHKISQP